ncbi:MAG TPA: hypothetical protein VMS77_04130 [Conexivisphaerales archaeon]|nr:hypothetical protein [Conexivisphaerales archaeon]
MVDLSGVTFSGAQFALYISPNGFSQINSSTDFLISPTFNVTSLGGAALHIGSYYLGTDSGHPFISGPITSTSVEIPGGVYYIKIFDGLTTAVAVSSQFVILLPAITIKPTFGPAGADLIVTGHAFAAGGTVNLSTQAPLATWFRTANTTADASGHFSVSLSSLGFRVPDLQNGASLIVPANVSQIIYVVAYDYGTGSSAQATFTEAYREFYWIQSYQSASTIGDDTGPGDWANDTAIDGWVLQNLFVSGLFFNPTTPTPTFTWDGSAITPTHLTAINSTGYFDANFTVPVSGLGPHFLKVFDATNNMTLEVNVQTTLIVSPTDGPEGSTVTVQGYGFDAFSNVTVYWWGTELVTPYIDPYTDSILLYSQNNISSGSFSFTFTVPTGVYGGDHTVYANDSIMPGPSEWTYAVANFFVDPSWSLSANSGALGSQFFVIGHGLPVGSSVYYTDTDDYFSQYIYDYYNHINPGNYPATGADAYAYQLTYDNVWAEYPAAFYGLASGLSGDDTGEANYTMVAAGVPMVHYVGVVRADFGTYVIDGSFAFTVTGSTTGDTAILAAIAGQAATLTSIQSSLTSLSSSVSTLTTTVNAIQTALTSLSSSQASSFASLNAAVAGINTAVTGLGTTVTNGFSSVNSAVSSLATSQSSGFSGLTTAVNGLGTTLGGKIDTVNNGVTTLTSSVSTLSGKVDTLSGTVSGIQGTIGTVKSSTDALSTMTTLLYLAIIIAAVCVVLEVIVLIRKK